MTIDRARQLRMRYLIAGAVLAGLWVGHANEPAWAHALRIGLILVTVRPLVILSRRYYARRWGSQASQTRAIVVLISTRLLALAGALVIATLVERLITHQPDSLKWLTLLRVGLLLATIPMQLRFMRNRATSNQAATMLNSARWNWLLVAKAALVAAALGLQVALDAVVGKRADLIVAVLMLAAVATLGPRLHARLFGVNRRQPPGEDQPVASQSVPAESLPVQPSPGQPSRAQPSPAELSAT
jgi:hypothetical protein